MLEEDVVGMHRAKPIESVFGGGNATIGIGCLSRWDGSSRVTYEKRAAMSNEAMYSIAAKEN